MFLTGHVFQVSFKDYATVEENKNLIVGAKKILIRSGLNKGVQEYFLNPRLNKSPEERNFSNKLQI
jgi:hypothetical protein